jgi:sulfonate dioxygenase
MAAESASTPPLYPSYLPTRPEGFTAAHEVPPFRAEEPGSRADPAKPELYTPKAAFKNLTPRVGTEVHGLQISQLSKAGLDQVALLAAERGVLVFVGLGNSLSAGSSSSC